MTRLSVIAVALVATALVGFGLWAPEGTGDTATAQAGGSKAQVLQINFKFKGSRADYERIVAPAVTPVAQVGGLRWKIWIINEATHEAGGIYLFADAASVKRFLASDLVKGITAHPALASFSVKQFDVMERETMRTRGPVKP